MAATSTPPRSAATGKRALTIYSVMVLIGVEVLGVALAGGWALAGLFELGDTVGHVLMTVFGLVGLYVMVLVWRRAHAVEAGTAH